MRVNTGSRHGRGSPPLASAPWTDVVARDEVCPRPGEHATIALVGIEDGGDEEVLAVCRHHAACLDPCLPVAASHPADPVTLHAGGQRILCIDDGAIRLELLEFEAAVDKQAMATGRALIHHELVAPRRNVVPDRVVVGTWSNSSVATGAISGSRNGESSSSPVRLGRIGTSIRLHAPVMTVSATCSGEGHAQGQYVGDTVKRSRWPSRRQ